MKPYSIRLITFIDRLHEVCAIDVRGLEFEELLCCPIETTKIRIDYDVTQATVEVINSDREIHCLPRDAPIGIADADS